jgi:hypothetical protein
VAIHWASYQRRRRWHSHCMGYGVRLGQAVFKVGSRHRSHCSCPGFDGDTEEGTQIEIKNLQIGYSLESRSLSAIIGCMAHNGWVLQLFWHGWRMYPRNSNGRNRSRRQALLGSSKRGQRTDRQRQARNFAFCMLPNRYRALRACRWGSVYCFRKNPNPNHL